ncbi:hypothetical protein [Asaia bogorensis]|uniref:hypothetical protein n=1 Tax=Asaia bogorensis TaxID=91915 RepID=UPI00285F5221|nr:hypothetical protein [Asaia bogorensis]MDR6181996.1 hypothetical protein [Asaia bogorensis NBRC 16594]
MTHEQKPESAEFRTREAQVARMCQLFHFPDADALNVTSASIITRNILEAEARGAAEQRRKDEPEFEKIIAERDEAEDFIRKMAETVLGEAVEWSNVYGFQNALNDVSERIFFLEKDTANVAALEDRVKELEAQLAQSEKRSFNHGYLIACCNISHLHDEPSIARDVLAECGLSTRDISTIELSDYDAKALSEIRVSRGDQDPIRSGEQL